MATVPEHAADDLLAEVDALVRRWLEVAAARPAHRSARRLADVLRDPAGLDFTVAFVDRVVRPEDARVCARSLRELAADVPAFVPRPSRAA
ncbi:MAG TPA: hypothetical protein VHB30_10645, partial [Solirubrobacteraceae bacterium]|nr:hypothetical protein [Solirubrobacteraceae bacterium]